MKIVPFNTLNHLQQSIAGWVGDKDGGQSAVDTIYWIHDLDKYPIPEIRDELLRMIDNGTLVASKFGDNLHYPGWRPNESRDTYEENRKGQWRPRKKKVTLKAHDIPYEVYVVTLPNNEERVFEVGDLPAAVKELGLDHRTASRLLKGVALPPGYKVKKERRIQHVPQKTVMIEEDTLIKPPKKGFDYAEATKITLTKTFEEYEEELRQKWLSSSNP